MHLVYLTANAAWVFTFGDSTIRLDGEPMFFDGPDARKNAVAAAARKGLAVAKNGEVTAVPVPA